MYHHRLPFSPRSSWLIPYCFLCWYLTLMAIQQRRCGLPRGLTRLGFCDFGGSIGTGPLPSQPCSCHYRPSFTVLYFLREREAPTPSLLLTLQLAYCRPLLPPLPPPGLRFCKPEIGYVPILDFHIYRPLFSGRRPLCPDSLDVMIETTRPSRWTLRGCLLTFGLFLFSPPTFNFLLFPCLIRTGGPALPSLP